jgi:hypothetical protein
VIELKQIHPTPQRLRFIELLPSPIHIHHLSTGELPALPIRSTKLVQDNRAPFDAIHRQQ